MKKYLFIALAALGFAACADKNEANGPVQNAEMEESYIAINLMAADNDTRAEDGGLDYGTEKERAIKTAYFFFFDENGNPFNVTGTPASAPGGSKNHLPLDITPITGNENIPVENVSDISNAVLVLNTYKGIYPKQIVAVLNWVPNADKAYTLDDLHETLATIGNDGDGYVMSNSVYMDSSNKMVDAVAITEDNIKTTSADALAAPIEIYVERIAAKVVLTANGKVTGTENIFSTQTTSQLVTPGDPVYVQLNGWELYNDYASSNLIKNIETDWTVENIGFNWNDFSYFRCYWADSQTTALADKFAWEYTDEEMAKNGFQTNYGFAVAPAVNSRTTYTYCGENTREWSEGNDIRTKVILKGQLMKKNGENYESLELASWYGNEYAGVGNLKIAVANSLAYTLFSSADGETFSSIKVEDIECVDNIAGLESYQVGFQLSAAGAKKTWYKYSSEKGYEAFGNIDASGDNAAEANAYLATVEPALLYTNGQTYYIVDIEHLGAPDKTAEYGVVRNHVYQIDIKSIKGYGSPVYSGFDYILTPPEYPEDYEDSYVAARINVLSWKVVKQGVDIVQ